MTPPGLELNKRWSHRARGAHRPEMALAVWSASGPIQPKKQIGEPPGSPICFCAYRWEARVLWWCWRRFRLRRRWRWLRPVEPCELLCGAATVESVDVAEGAEPADCAEANAGIDARTKRAKIFFI